MTEGPWAVERLRRRLHSLVLDLRRLDEEIPNYGLDNGETAAIRGAVHRSREQIELSRDFLESIEVEEDERVPAENARLV